MRPEDFDYLCRLLKDRSGLVLTKDRSYLVDSRLMPLAHGRNLGSVDGLVSALRTAGPRSPLAAEVADAMTTNDSFFFRDIKPFEQFRQVALPRLIESRPPDATIRIWSAACSSGQEPYSLAMILREEEARLEGRRVEILATDLSARMLEKAEAGLYNQFEIQRGLPVRLMIKYFRQVGDKWEIDPALAAMVEFRSFNLIDDPAPLGTFDVVFCRNVLTYFDHATKRLALERIRGIMPDDGVLYLGGAETVTGLSDRFRPAPGQRGIYAPAGDEVPPQAAAAPRTATL